MDGDRDNKEYRKHIKNLPSENIPGQGPDTWSTNYSH